ncbi:MAG: hypothetical protein E7509_01380 [Ruminococcus sp.]|nr:hypothetical protein [Ruminococcus sp.]
MSFKKRILAACAAVVMACSLAGCGGKDTNYIMKADGEEIASGVYINLMLTEYTNQLYNLYYAGEKLAPTFEEQKIEGQLMSKFLEDYAYRICLEIVAVEKKCKELGITLTDEEKKEVESTVDNFWEQNEAYYKKMGVSRDSLTRIQNYSTLMVKLFEGLYYEGGVEEVSLEEVTKFVNENFVRYKMIQFKIDTEDEEATKKKSEKYMAYAEEGKTMDELLEIYAKETEEEEKKDEESKDEDSKDETSKDETSKDETSKDEESDKTDDTTTDDTDSESDDSTTDDTADDKEEEKDDESSDTETDTDAETEKEEEEKTPSQIESEKYPNELVRNASDAKDDKLIEFISKLECDKISSYKDEKYYYIIERLEMSGRTEFPEANREGVVTLMKTETYEALLKSMSDALKIEKNEKAFERYNAIDVFKRQDKWYEKNAE